MLLLTVFYVSEQVQEEQAKRQQLQREVEQLEATKKEVKTAIAKLLNVQEAMEVSQWMPTFRVSIERYINKFYMFVGSLLSVLSRQDGTYSCITSFMWIPGWKIVNHHE